MCDSAQGLYGVNLDFALRTEDIKLELGQGSPPPKNVLGGECKKMV